MKKLYIVILSVISSISGICLEAATVTWHGTSVFNVTDSDLILKEKIDLPVGTTIVRASTVDVAIHLKGDPELRSNKLGNSSLIFTASAGRTITVYVDDKVTLRSVKNNSLDLLENGDGNIIWIIKNKK